MPDAGGTRSVGRGRARSRAASAPLRRAHHPCAGARRPFRCGAALLIAGLTAGLVLIAGPAAAHPFGPPPVAEVSAGGRSVVIHWRASADDAVAVGVQLGMLSPDVIEAYREGPVQVAAPEEAELALTRSQALRDYLLERIVVSQDGQACAGAVEPMENFVTDGARVAYTCPAAIEAVELRITMLHDAHPAYRTFAVAEDPADPGRSVHTRAAPAADWRFGVPAETQTTVWRWPPLLALAAAAAGAGAWWWRRRRGAAEPTAADAEAVTRR